MKGRAGAYIQGGLLVVIVLLGIGYLRFNTGIDNAYAACRDVYDVAACTCWREGYAEVRSIFTEVPLFGGLIRRDIDAFDEHMAAVRARCGMMV